MAKACLAELPQSTRVWYLAAGVLFSDLLKDKAPCARWLYWVSRAEAQLQCKSVWHELSCHPWPRSHTVSAPFITVLRTTSSAGA